VSRLLGLLPPELRQFPTDEQGDASLDLFEWVGMSVGLVGVAALTRYVLPETSMATRVGAMALNFAVALALLGLALGPFHIRRLRRGLRKQLSQRRSP
jgi:hypothetical protein